MSTSLRNSSIMNGMDSDSIASRQRDLLDWYDRRGRDLPWRRNTTLYGTWISEIMLQQTTVATVIPRWERFLARFPEVGDLAAADEEQILAEWSGLGYYRRARLLHQAARQVMDEGGGSLPETLEGWHALPGVGEYTAGAIASIALALPVPAVDANIRRVLTRWVCPDRASAEVLTPGMLRALAVQHLPESQAGDWNQALMDLGSGPCKARKATCDRCPVATQCAAGNAGSTAEVPLPSTRPKSHEIMVGQLVARQAGSIFLLPGSQAVVARARGLGRPFRQDLQGVLEGLLWLPSTPWYQAPNHDGSTPLLAAWRSWLRNSGWTQPKVTLVGERRHTITNHRLRLVVAETSWPKELPAEGLGAGYWTPWPASDIPISTMVRRCLSNV